MGCSSEFFSKQTTRILTMKFFIIASLVAFVAVETESDPALVYTHHGLTHLTNGFVRYPNGAVVPQDTASVQATKGLHLSAKALVHPYHLLPKVLPKAVVPTTDVDQVDTTQKVIPYGFPTYPFYTGYPHMTPYGAYPYTTPLTTGVAPIYTSPLTHHVHAPYHHLIKREAEAEAEADPALVYHHGGPHLTHGGHHMIQYGYPAYSYGYPTTMGYNAYPAVPYKYPTTTYRAYPYTTTPYTTPYTTHTGVAPVPYTAGVAPVPYTAGVAPVPYTAGFAPVTYTAPLTHTITPASTTKLVRNVMPLAPKLF